MMYRLRLPGALARLARARADKEGTTLDAVLIAALTRYADGTPPTTVAQLASMGGRARAATRDPADYAAMGRASAEARRRRE